jgi:hypothetical protein
MGVRKGSVAGAEAAKKQQGVRSRVRYLTSEATLKDENDRVFVRLITEADEWLYVDMHQFVPTKEKPEDFEGKWPEKMSAVCQNDQAFMDDSTGQYMDGFGDCYICKAPQYKALDRFKKPVNKTSLRGWALLCLRDAVQEDGRIVGFQDSVVEIRVGKDKDAKTEEVRNIVVAQMSHKNFWANLNTQYNTFGTVRDRDYLVTVTGEGVDKNFTFINMDPIADHKPGTESWKLYEEACEKQGLDLFKIICDQGNDEYYDKFFRPVAGGKAAKVSTADEPQDDAGPAKPTEAAMDDLLKRIKGHGGTKKPDADAA